MELGKILAIMCMILGAITLFVGGRCFIKGITHEKGQVSTVIDEMNHNRKCKGWLLLSVVNLVGATIFLYIERTF